MTSVSIKDFWDFVEVFDYPSDENYDKLRNTRENYSKKEIIRFRNMFENMKNMVMAIQEMLEEETPIGISKDEFSTYVISKGKDTFESIMKSSNNKKKLLEFILDLFLLIKMGYHIFRKSFGNISWIFRVIIRIEILVTNCWATAGYISLIFSIIQFLKIL